MSRNDELLVPAMSIGRLHSKAAVIDESIVYMGSVNLDPRSDSTNTELGILADCPELARQVIEVIGMSQRASSYRLRFANDGVTLEWLTTTDAGEVVLTQEPETTPPVARSLQALVAGGYEIPDWRSFKRKRTGGRHRRSRRGRPSRVLVFQRRAYQSRHVGRWHPEFRVRDQ